MDALQSGRVKFHIVQPAADPCVINFAGREEDGDGPLDISSREWGSYSIAKRFSGAPAIRCCPAYLAEWGMCADCQHRWVIWLSEIIHSFTYAIAVKIKEIFVYLVGKIIVISPLWDIRYSPV